MSPQTLLYLRENAGTHFCHQCANICSGSLHCCACHKPENWTVYHSAKTIKVHHFQFRSPSRNIFMIEKEGESHRNRLYRSANTANSHINNVCIPSTNQKMRFYLVWSLNISQQAGFLDPTLNVWNIKKVPQHTPPSSHHAPTAEKVAGQYSC